MSVMILAMTPAEFVAHLNDDVIPDLRATGQDATAEDFQLAADIIRDLLNQAEYLRAEISDLERRAGDDA